MKEREREMRGRAGLVNSDERKKENLSQDRVNLSHNNLNDMTH